MKTKSLKHIFFSSLILFCWVAIIGCVSAYVLLTTTWGAKLAATYVIESYIPFCNVHIGEYQGTIEKGLKLKNVTITRIPWIKDAIIHAQDLQIRVPLKHWDQVEVNIVNAKIVLPGSDPLVFTGTIINKELKGNCYSNNIDAKQVVAALGYDELARNIYGYLSKVDFKVEGTVTAPRLRGHFIVDKFIYKNHTQLTDGFSNLDLTFVSLGEHASLRGFIIMQSALVRVGKVGIDLTTSKVDFDGDVRDFKLDIHGVSRIEDIMIDMAIKETFKKPKLIFNSDPPMSEEMILIALATGKAWSATESDQGIGLRRKLTDSFKVGMEVKEWQTQVGNDQPLGYSRTLEGQMKVTDKFSLNVAKKYLPANASSPATGVGSSSSPRQDQSEIYLQYKQRF